MATIAWGIINIAVIGIFVFHMNAYTSSTPKITTISGLSTKPLTHIAFSSDIHFGSNANSISATHNILQTIRNGNYDAFFILGDIAELGFPGNKLTDAAQYIVSEIPNIPLSTLMGNHDALIGGVTRYQAIYNQNLYYRIDSGTTHIIALNLLWGTETMDNTQKEWLMTALSSIPHDDTTIVLSHCFFWSSGYTDANTHKKWYDQNAMTQEIAPILEEAGVDLIVSGHNHFMEYLERTIIGNNSKTGYVIIGTMGGKPDPERDYVSPYSLWYDGSHFGFLELTVFEKRLELIFRDDQGHQLYSRVIRTGK